MITAEVVSNKTVSFWSAKRISIILTIVALVLWSISITQAKLTVGFLGLIYSFPIIYFISLGILSLASVILWFSQEHHWKLLLLQLFFLVVSIFLIPIIIGGSPPTQRSFYLDMGIIEYIFRMGHFSGDINWAYCWPVPYLIWGMGMQICGLNMSGMEAMIPWIPFLWQIIYFFPVFIFFRNIFGKNKPNYVWAGMWLFYLWQWTPTAQTGGESFGPFLIFSLLALLTTNLSEGFISAPFWKRMLGILLIVLSAPLQFITSLVGLGIIAALLISKRLTSQRLLILSIIVIVAWSMYGAAIYFNWNLLEFIKTAFSIISATGTAIVEKVSGNEQYAAVSLVRIVFSAMITLLAILGAILIRKRRNITFNDVTVLAILAGIGFTGIFIGSGYKYELFNRIFLFVLPALIYFAIKLLNFKITSVIMGVFVLVAVPLVFVATYGNQQVDYLSPSYHSASETFYTKTTNGYYTGLIKNENIDKYTPYWIFDRLVFENGILVSAGMKYSTFRHYILINDTDRQIYKYFHNKPQFIDDIQNSLDESTNCDLVFANKDTNLYLSER